VCLQLRVDGVRCARGHLVCGQCAKDFAKHYESGPLLCPKNNPHVDRRCMSDSWAPRRLKRFADTYWDGFLERYQRYQQWNRDFGVARLRMCKRCGLGPVANSGCGDLALNHQRRTREGDKEFFWNNACPRCGWFASNADAWPPWDEQYHEMTSK
jgi:hypothetical protein